MYVSEAAAPPIDPFRRSSHGGQPADRVGARSARHGTPLVAAFFARGFGVSAGSPGRTDGCAAFGNGGHAALERRGGNQRENRGAPDNIEPQGLSDRQQ